MMIFDFSGLPLMGNLFPLRVINNGGNGTRKNV